MNLTGTIHWGTLSQNRDIFLFLKLGIFSLVLEKTYFFCNWEHDSKWVLKMCQKSFLVFSEISRTQLHLYHYTYSRQIYIARQRIFWSKLLPDSLNRMNTHALIIFSVYLTPTNTKVI